MIVEMLGFVKPRYCAPSIARLFWKFGHEAGIPIRVNIEPGSLKILIINGVVMINVIIEPAIISRLGICRNKNLRCGCKNTAPINAINI